MWRTPNSRVSMSPSRLKKLLNWIMWLSLSHLLKKRARTIVRVTYLSQDVFVMYWHVTVSTTYKFTSEQGEYTFEPKNIFYAVNPVTQQIEIIKAEVAHFSVHISREDVHPVAPSVPEEQPEIREISVYEKSETRASDSVRHENVAYEMPEARTYSIQYAPVVRIANDVVVEPIEYVVSLTLKSTKLIVLAIGLLNALKIMQPLLKLWKPRMIIWRKKKS